MQRININLLGAITPDAQQNAFVVAICVCNRIVALRYRSNFVGFSLSSAEPTLASRSALVLSHFAHVSVGDDKHGRIVHNETSGSLHKADGKSPH